MKGFKTARPKAQKVLDQLLKWDFILNENIDIFLGDLNEDEIINIQDVIILINISLSEIDPTDYQEISGDLNEDGAIDILDIINCINIILNT